VPGRQIGWYGQNATLDLGGDVTLTRSPDGWTGTSFECLGTLSSDIDDGWLAYQGFDSGVNYYWSWEPTGDNGGLNWTGTCPVEGLPLAPIGLSPAARLPIVQLGYDGTWGTQHTPSRYSIYDAAPVYYLTDRWTLTQADTVTWSGSYYVAE